jgi:CHASE3 domain sensor protein
MGRTWTFGQRLGAGFALVVLLAVVMAAVGFYALRTVVEDKDRVIQHNAQDVIDAERMNAAVQRESANFRGYLLTGEQRFIDRMQESDAQFASAVERIRERGVTSAIARQLEAIMLADSDRQRAADRIAEMREGASDLQAVATAFERDVTPKTDALVGAVSTFATEAEKAGEDARKAASDRAAQAITVLVAAGFGAVALATIIAVVLSRALSRQIGSSVLHLRSASAELQASATQQASGTKEQSTAMNEIGTTIGELLATSRQIAESGQHVAKMAAESARGAREGTDAVDKARDAVSSIQRQVDAIVQHMLNLGRKSQQIGGILEIINELSEQTNILAINATIEAAGAGEAGRRFAVVGEEIRKLADRVGGSTKEIRALIEEIRAAVNATVMATETGSKTVEAGAQRFAELQAAFSRIGEIVASTMQAGKEIELSTKQQATAVEQVNLAIANVSQATKETEAGSTQTLQTASQMTLLSDELARLVQPQQA